MMLPTTARRPPRRAAPRRRRRRRNHAAPKPPQVDMLRALGLMLIALALLRLEGCAAKPASPIQSASNAAVAAAASQQLAQLAERERSRPAKHINVPVPPGVEPEVLARRSPTNADSALSLDEALRAIAGQ